MADPTRSDQTRSDPTRRWPALDIGLRAAASGSEPAADADLEGLLLAFLDDHAPTAITAPPGGEAGWLVTASHDATPAWLPGPAPAAGGPPTLPHTPRAWRVFFASTERRDAARAALASGEWSERVDVAAVEVEDEGWAERSQAALRAVQVGRLIIAPPWDADPAGAAPLPPRRANNARRGPRLPPRRANNARRGPRLPPRRANNARRGPRLQQVIIEPSMGFGTGHHESTRLCLHALQAIDLVGRRVLDLGTGSGVLAIAAAMLGAESVLGLDDDRDAVDAARENVQLNGLGARVSVKHADLALMEPQAADVVLANLTGALLIRCAQSIVRHLAPGGLLIVSGFTEDERFAVAHAFRELRLAREDREDGWVGLTLGIE